MSTAVALGHAGSLAAPLLAGPPHTPVLQRSALSATWSPQQQSDRQELLGLESKYEKVLRELEKIKLKVKAKAAESLKAQRALSSRRSKILKRKGTDSRIVPENSPTHINDFAVALHGAVATAIGNGKEQVSKYKMIQYVFDFVDQYLYADQEFKGGSSSSGAAFFHAEYAKLQAVSADDLAESFDMGGESLNGSGLEQVREIMPATKRLKCGSTPLQI